MPTPQQKLLLFNQPRFTPLQIPGCVRWYPVDQVTGLNDGATLATLPDRSGNAGDASNAGATPVIYKKAIVNGLPVARFDGLSSYLSTAAINLTATAGVTTFIVGKMTTNGANQIFLEDAANFNLNQPAYLLYYDNASGLFNVVHLGNTGYSTSTRTGALTSFSILSHKSNFALTAALEAMGYMNGAIFPTRGTDTNNTNTAFGNHQAFIGCRSGGTVAPLLGDISEIIIYNRALLSTEQKQVESYLSKKYSVPLAA